jgi:hypothetical protein
MMQNRYISTSYIAFIPNPENKPFVNHIDGNKINNNASNLEWVTSQENHTHAMITGLKAKGNKHGMSKLTEENAYTVKEMLSNRISQRKIASFFNVCQATIGDINKGITWRHI